MPKWGINISIAEVPPPFQNEAGAAPEEAGNAAAVAIMVQIVMLGLAFLAGHTLRRNNIMVIHEAGTALALGVLVGLVVRLAGHTDSTWINFNEKFFFYFLLPPIIFESGWSLRIKPFFHNFGAICVFAFLGTAISTFGVGLLIYIFGTLSWTYSMPFLACLAYGALISATDPVTVLAIFHALGADANLYAYVFGESVLNDAVAIVMYKTVLSFIKHPEGAGIIGAFWFFIVIFIGSFSIGVIVSLLSALLFRHCGLQEKGLAILESCLMCLFPYLAYNMADALELSGIVAILFAGITMKYYTAPNLSVEAQQITTSFFGMLAKLSETFVFIYMGVALFLNEQTWNNFGFVFFTILSILIARAWNVYPCAALVNNYREPPRQIPMNHQHALWFSGLRGAMAFALALQAVSDIPDNHGRVMLTATMFTIFFTVLLIGGTTSYALMYLQVECHGPDFHGDENEPPEPVEEDLDEEISYDPNVDGGGLQALAKQKAAIAHKLRKLKNYESSFATLDKKYLRPFFVPDAIPEGTSHHDSELHRQMTENIARMSAIHKHEAQLARLTQLEEQRKSAMRNISSPAQAPFAQTPPRAPFAQTPPRAAQPPFAQAPPRPPAAAPAPAPYTQAQFPQAPLNSPAQYAYSQFSQGPFSTQTPINQPQPINQGPFALTQPQPTNQGPFALTTFAPSRLSQGSQPTYVQPEHYTDSYTNYSTRDDASFPRQSH